MIGRKSLCDSYGLKFSHFLFLWDWYCWSRFGLWSMGEGTLFFFFGMVGYAWSFCWKSKYWNSIWNSLVFSPISQSFTLLSVFSKARKWALPFYFTLDLFDDLHFLSVLILFHYLGNVLLQVKDPRNSNGLGVYR